jgi:hypothetical protein
MNSPVGSWYTFERNCSYVSACELLLMVAVSVPPHDITITAVITPSRVFMCSAPSKANGLRLSTFWTSAAVV